MRCLVPGLIVLFASITPSYGGPIVGIDIDTGNGAPTNWNSYLFSDVNSVKSGLTAENGVSTSVGFLLSGATVTQTVGVASTFIPAHTTPLDLVAGDVFGGGPNPNQVVWSGLVPFATYNYWVFVSSSADDIITATGSTIDSFSSPAVSANSQRINGILGSNALTFTSYARQVNASATGTIDIGILSTGTPTPSGYAVQLVSEVPEPTSLALFGFGGLGLIAARRRLQAV
jgi:hypothetical protein